MVITISNLSEKSLSRGSFNLSRPKSLRQSVGFVPFSLLLESYALEPPTSNLKVIPFDYLILAMGADYRKPITASTSDVTMEERAATWDREAAAVQQAQTVSAAGKSVSAVDLDTLDQSSIESNHKSSTQKCFTAIYLSFNEVIDGLCLVCLVVGTLDW
eukprot:1465408-Amphidinium_carterae.1